MLMRSAITEALPLLAQGAGIPPPAGPRAHRCDERAGGRRGLAFLAGFGDALLLRTPQRRPGHARRLGQCASARRCRLSRCCHPDHFPKTVNGLGKTFGDKVAFADVSFEIGYGEVFGFLGPNGVGKPITRL
jgi:hypothetical protein